MRRGPRRGAVPAVLCLSLACGASDEVSQPPAAPASPAAARPAWTDALVEIRDRALGEESVPAYLTVATAVGISAKSPGALPAALAEAAQLSYVVPFVGALEPPHSDVPRRGNWYDPTTQAAFIDAAWVGAVDGTGDPARAGALQFALALTLADGARTALGERWSEEVRCAAAGALVRTFLASPGDVEPVPQSQFTHQLELLEAGLAAVAPAGVVTAPLPGPGRYRAFARGYREPDLDFTGAFRSER